MMLVNNITLPANHHMYVYVHVLLLFNLVIYVQLWNILGRRCGLKSLHAFMDCILCRPCPPSHLPSLTPPLPSPPSPLSSFTPLLPFPFPPSPLSSLTLPSVTPPSPLSLTLLDELIREQVLALLRKRVRRAQVRQQKADQQQQQQPAQQPQKSVHNTRHTHVHVHVLGKVTALGVLCCFALFVCLTLLASFFHLSFKNMYIHG